MLSDCLVSVICFLSTRCFFSVPDLRKCFNFEASLRRSCPKLCYGLFTRFKSCCQLIDDTHLHKIKNRGCGAYSATKAFCNVDANKFEKRDQGCEETIHALFRWLFFFGLFAPHTWCNMVIPWHFDRKIEIHGGATKSDHHLVVE